MLKQRFHHPKGKASHVTAGCAADEGEEKDEYVGVDERKPALKFRSLRRLLYK